MTAPARDAGIRTVCMRTCPVLIPGIQFLGRLVPLFKVGLGGPIGSGNQWWSWITLADQLRVVRLAMESDIEGPVNVTSPNPVQQRDFAKTLGKVLGRPAVVPVPPFAVRIRMGAEAADAVGLSSIRVVPERLLSSGFEFSDPELEPALRSILG